MPVACNLPVSLACTAIAAAGPVGTPTAAPEAIPASPPPLIQKLYRVRASRGIPRLRYSPALSRSSRRFARHLMARDRLAHASRIWAPRRFRRLGEVLALHRGWQPQPAVTMRQWLHSPEHRRVVLSRSFGFVGAGSARGRFGRRPATIWVAQVGRR